MRTYPIIQVDAFTNTPLTGNPCAVVLDADTLSEAEMQAIARETNLSETAFVMRSEQGDFRARYFTPAEEIPLAGHPTLATTRALIDCERYQPQGERSVLRLELNVGVIDVEIDTTSGMITMTQKKPEFLNTYQVADIAPVFGLRLDDFLPSVPLQTVSTGTPQLMLPLIGHDALKRAQLDVTRYTALRAKADFFSPHLFCVRGVTGEGQTFARHFGTPPDLMEDPFTGSATGGMAAYLWRYGLIKESRLAAEQGHWMGRPGRGFAEVIGAPDDIQAVRVGGQAVVVMRGELTL